MKESVVQCLLFVVNEGTPRSFVLIPSAAIEDHPNVCELFTRNSVEILKNGAEYPTLQEALERNQVEVLELIVLSSTDKKLFTYESESFIPVSVVGNNEELVRQLFGKDAAVFRYYNIGYYADFLAIDDGNSEVLKRLLTFRAEFTYKNRLGGTLLHLAVRHQNDTLVQLLLDHGVNVNAVNNDGLTALHCAVKLNPDPFHNIYHNSRDNLWTIVNLLLDAGAAVNARTKDGSTSLLLAMKEHSFHMVRLLLKHNADANIGDLNGLTPLHVAVKANDVEIVEDLLRHNANVNATVTYCHSQVVTPLWLAVEESSLAVVKRLLAKGADLNIACYDNQTILELAVELEHVQIVEWILKHHPSPNDKLDQKVPCKPVFQNDKAQNRISKLLTAYGFIIDTVDRNEAKLLHDAVTGGNQETVIQILEAGANVNKVYHYLSSYGNIAKTLPLFTAVDNGFINITKLLISHGANVHAKLNLNDGEHPALDKAVFENRTEISAALLAEHDTFSCATGHQLFKMAIMGDNPDLLEEALRKDAKACETLDDEIPCLLFAVEEDNHKAIEILLKAGVSIDSRDCLGNTVLHYTFKCQTNHREVIKFLVQNNADLEARNFEGVTPVFIATRCNEPNVVVDLLKYGACMDAADESGCTSFFRAVCLDSLSMFEALLQFHFTDTDLIQRTDIYKFFNLSYVESLRDSSGWLKEVYDWYNNNRQTFKNHAETLARHMIRQKAAFPEKNVFDFCSRHNLKSVLKREYLLPSELTEADEWLDFRNQCENEVAKLKSNNIGDSCVSFYDALTKSEDEVSSYLQNPSILQAMESKSYETEFPLYTKILSYQFEKGSLRRGLLNEGREWCHLLAGVFEDLPVHLKEKTLSYLTNRELEVAVYACKCIAD